ncbi:membrane fusion protein, multidrug efflux system [Burkholderia sp. GAS332]|nr:membrane fusion protein, multidrug efflux system [Burkholderia sp. GAS332]
MKTTRSILLALAVVTLLAGCGKGHSEASEAAAQPQEVAVVTVRPSAAPLTVELPGRLEAYRQAEVRARVAGIVTARLYEEGQEVHKNAPLFRIDPAPLKAARDVAAGSLARAEANALGATDKRKRYDDLVTDHAVSERDHTEALTEERQAKAEVASARAELERARLQLSYATVTAPIDGRARRALVTEGALVGQDSATPLTTVEQIDPIYVNFSQPAADVAALRRAIDTGRVKGVAQKDVKVRLTLPDGSEYIQTGTLLFTDLAVDPGTDTVAMRALFPNPRRELLPGAYVRITLDRAIDTAVIAVPRDAVSRTADEASVKVVDAAGKVAVVPVQVNELKGRNWLVTSGLKGGERVVVENAATLEPGAVVKPRERATESQTDAKTAANT